MRWDDEGDEDDDDNARNYLTLLSNLYDDDWLHRSTFLI